MSKKYKKKLEMAAKKQEAQAQDKKKVLMRFSENKYYNDLAKPMFEAGKVYELEGADWINRWIKRGGEIVTDGKAEESEQEQHAPEPVVEAEEDSEGDLAPEEKDSEEVEE